MLVENILNHTPTFFKKKLRRQKNLARVIRLRNVTIIEHECLPEHRNLENFNCLNYHRKSILFVALLAFDCFSENELVAERSSFEMPLGAIIASPRLEWDVLFGMRAEFRGESGKLDVVADKDERLCKFPSFRMVNFQRSLLCRDSITGNQSEGG
ncbi:hypothetical protein CEXT_754051 [Caerostris extrusa]|uniref:Uncharacterized protein n=1 Tax=Caerostris extrusa TaxID=172846 RepID=A0AAV4Q0H9_CAEEX|nr:hypothetical protein CEXT_754051 [Caerostris extrusa]